jgi:hypothetical protein
MKKSSVPAFLILAFALPSAAMADAICADVSPICYEKARHSAADAIKAGLLKTPVTDPSVARLKLGVNCRSTATGDELRADFSADVEGTVEVPGQPPRKQIFSVVGKVDVNPESCAAAALLDVAQVMDYVPVAH